MKKLFSLALSLAMVFLLSAAAFAATPLSGYPSTQKIEINEYEAFKKLAEETPAVLSASGYSSAEIAKIQNYQETYFHHITELQTLSDNALVNHGYTKTQIDIIKNFTGTEEEMSRAAASLTIYAGTSSFKYVDGGYTTGRLAYSWNWSGVPAVKMKDMVAAAWNGWELTGETSRVYYHDIYTGAAYTTQSATHVNPTNASWNGRGHKFDMAISDNLYYAKSGSGSFDVKSDGLYQKNFLYCVEYGHETILWDISFSVSAPGGGAGSISFSVGTSVAGSDSGAFRWDESQ